MATNALKILCYFIVIIGILFRPSFADECTEENAQSASCRGIKAYFYAKYKMDLAVGAGINLLSVSCDMKKANRQCRNYALLESSKSKLEEMKEGCLSMGGSVSSEKCTEDDKVASCHNIVRNYHAPDVIYSTVYYQPVMPNGLKIKNDLHEIKLTCQNLGGKLKSPKSTH
ncbi:MAG: hypothetical protein ACI9T9_000015 [Oleiphilaceae bacterium]|jgi:hypothetical protein